MKMTKLLRTRIPSSLLPKRSRDEWDSIKAYPYDLPDEHEEPKNDEFVREVFERHYYHFHDKARIADTHLNKNKFFEYRQWQHLYTAPEHAFLRWNHGSAILKYMLFLFPLSVFIYFLYYMPNKNKFSHGRRIPLFWKKNIPFCPN
jgi:hypothetical protein